MPRMVEALEWKRRRGRFKDCDEDTEERPQIMPGLQPKPELQTHTRTGEDDRGAPTYMDS
jgi:hypothetical protein